MCGRCVVYSDIMGAENIETLSHRLERNILNIFPIGVVVGVVGLLIYTAWSEYKSNPEIPIYGGQIDEQWVLCGSGELGDVRKYIAESKFRFGRSEQTTKFYQLNYEGKVVERGDMEMGEVDSRELGAFCFEY